jgi:hypothetical protein
VVGCGLEYPLGVNFLLKVTTFPQPKILTFWPKNYIFSEKLWDSLGFPQIRSDTKHILTWKFSMSTKLPIKTKMSNKNDVSEHYQIRRTCTDDFEVNFFMVNHACMTEGHRHGHMCFCEEDECNAAFDLNSYNNNFYKTFLISFMFIIYRYVFLILT